MSQENVEAVERILAEWAAGDLGAAIGDSTPTSCLSFDPPSRSMGCSWVRMASGTTWARFLAQWERYAIEGKNVQAVGDTVLAGDPAGHGGGSSMQTETPSFVLFTSGRQRSCEWISCSTSGRPSKPPGCGSSRDLAESIWTQRAVVRRRASSSSSFQIASSGSGGAISCKALIAAIRAAALVPCRAIPSRISIISSSVRVIGKKP